MTSFSQLETSLSAFLFETRKCDALGDYLGRLLMLITFTYRINMGFKLYYRGAGYNTETRNTETRKLFYMGRIFELF